MDGTPGNGSVGETWIPGDEFHFKTPNLSPIKGYAFS